MNFCRKVTYKHPDISNATARLAVWFIGAAELTGGFPLELTLRQINEGFEKEGEFVEGTGCRRETMNYAIEWLTRNKFLEVKPGSPVGFGHSSHLYTMV